MDALKREKLILLSKIVIKKVKIKQNRSMRRIKFLRILLFFLIPLFFGVFFSQVRNNLLITSANHKEINNVEIIVNNQGQKYNYLLNLLDDASETKLKLINNKEIVEIIAILENMKFTDEEIVCYLFPEIKKIYKKLEKNIEKKEIPDQIYVVKNKCKIKIQDGKYGHYLNKQKFFSDILKSLKKDTQTIVVNLEILQFKNEGISISDYQKRGEFSTYFASSSDERKNNIKVALEKFDGLILNEGEMLSFNATTGARNKEAGYRQAKIISGGTFSSGYGGGVCQVSTTLYNACLLAGLEILEVHNHSLPVSYIEPSFDAMVNMGSSDLIIKNNTNGKIIITTSSEGDVCRVAIFGKENKYKIERVSKKLEILPASNEKIIETNLAKYGIKDLEKGEEIVISQAKDGLKSEGYLNYYDKEGNIFKTKKIRENIYFPTKAVSVRKEN